MDRRMHDQVAVSGLKRGELAECTGCHLETVRYYEKIGLLSEPPRAANGYRVYNEGHLKRLRFILRGRELGFSIEEIRSLLQLVDGGSPTCAEVKARADRHLTSIRERIADLRHIERVLTRTAAQCSGDAVPHCPILDALAS
jgi:MerR family mercuric resistance operon transcriptional regulator